MQLSFCDLRQPKVGVFTYPGNLKAPRSIEFWPPLWTKKGQVNYEYSCTARSLSVAKNRFRCTKVCSDVNVVCWSTCCQIDMAYITYPSAVRHSCSRQQLLSIETHKSLLRRLWGINGRISVWGTMHLHFFFKFSIQSLLIETLWKLVEDGLAGLLTCGTVLHSSYGFC